MKRKNTQIARTLRKNSTDAERLLWNNLRARIVEDLKFRRQYQIDNYIVDFVCLEKRVVIEVDGSQHLDSKVDLKRDAYLALNGYRVVRVWNNEVLENIEGVVDRIIEECK